MLKKNSSYREPIRVTIALVVAIGGIGCTSDLKEPQICEAGDTRCYRNMLQRCDADGWADYNDYAVLEMDCSTLNGEAQCVATGR